MPAEKRIAILLHESDHESRLEGYFIWALREVWREQGIQVEIIKGIRHHVQADLLIPHVDATVLPPAYADFLAKYPRVINRSVRDISKRTISQNILARNDSYDGPVIVKTNLNCGGGPELPLTEPKIFFSREKINFWRGWFNRKQYSSDWSKINCMKSEDYQVFASLKEVPDAVFANPWLVVERFLPEHEKGIYYLRIYKFFGDRAYGARLGSPNPIVKQKNIVHREDIPIPDEVIEARSKLGMDYGKLDFVVHDGRVIILDVNRTPGRFGPESRMHAKAHQLAPGIESFF